MKNSIRLRYSGFVIFVARVLSVATGLAFQYMIARSTSPSEYGVWFNINDMLSYFTIMAGIVPFWVMRFVARGEEGAAKTGVITNLAISAVATLVYVISIPVMTSVLGVQQYLNLYILVSVQIVEFYLLNASEAVLRAKKPQTLGYGLIVAEVSKVVLGFALIMSRLVEPLIGAIISITIAVVAELIYYSWLLSEDFKQKVKWIYAKEWFKGSVANVYNVIGNQIASFIFIMLFSYGGEAARGSYGAATQIANVITYSAFLAFPLYPKFLAERNSQDVTTSIKMVLMFAIPMTVGAITVPDLFLSILKSEYIQARNVLVVLSIDALVATISTLFAFVLYGFERVDEKARISFKELFRSRLFLSFSLSYFHSAITLPLTYFVLTTYTRNDPILSAFSVAIINSAARFLMFLVLYFMVRGMVKVVIPWKNIAKYVFASLIMGCLIYWLNLKLQLTRVHQILGLTAFAGVFYLALLMSIDEDARTLAKLAWQEIKGALEAI
ncbi:MAG: hypothetical protein QXZ68_02975 [Candidatus Bathyarchaeia archaeon]